MERLSISLDDDSAKLIEKYKEKYGTSKADIIRRALRYLSMVEEATEKVPLDNIDIYIDYLAEMEHVIVDIAYWELIFNEIGEGSEEFWVEVFEIGEDHGTEYFDKGIKDVRQILEYVEKTNWYKLKIDSENSFTLILPVSKSSRFVKTFLEGFFKNQPRKVTITEEHKKIRIKIH
ncbi:MAG: CopG family transcriptional regulator [Thermoplasmata archaeon]|nr:MAG: CopG family transcriptional regulator [Thermoplasmata archaeon]